MCEMQRLRASVEQILTAAAEEIFGVFKRSMAEIEETFSNSPLNSKSNQRLPDALSQTDILILPKQQGRSPHVDQEDPEPTNVKEEQEEKWLSQEGEQTVKLTLLSERPTLIQKLWMVKEELPLEQQERSPSLDQVDPEPPHTKKEENLWTSQEGEQLQGVDEAVITKFPSTPPHVKSEYDEDKYQSSQLHQSQTEEKTEEPEKGENHGESEPNGIQKDISISNGACKTKQHQYTEEDEKCKVLSVSETQMAVTTIKEPFSCSVCNKVFTYKSIYKRHMLVHTGEKPFSCTVCKKGFARKSLVEEHMSIHTGKKPFSCSVCKKDFARKSEVNHHMLVHTREKPFFCPFCNKGFARKFDVKHHMLVHTGEKPFSCSVCMKGFAHKGNLKSHMSVHTGERPFICTVCEKAFSNKGNLNKHMCVHTGEKPFCCSVCNKGFVYKSKLKRHMSLHTREKSFSCSVCNKGFVYKCKLKEHMLIHTGKKASIY